MGSPSDGRTGGEKVSGGHVRRRNCWHESERERARAKATRFSGRGQTHCPLINESRWLSRSFFSFFLLPADSLQVLNYPLARRGCMLARSAGPVWLHPVRRREEKLPEKWEKCHAANEHLRILSKKRTVCIFGRAFMHPTKLCT